MYTIRPATEHDVPSLTQIIIQAFARTPFWENLFPEGTTDPRPLKTARTLSKLLDPTTHVLVAEHPSTGRIVGYARWTLPSSSTSTSCSSTVPTTHPRIPAISEEAQRMASRSSELFPSGGNRAAYDSFYEGLERGKKRYLSEGDFVLELLATLPEEQGKGVASGLLRWGLERADAVNARVYLEATEEGYPIYRKYGWRDLGEFRMDFEEFGGWGVQRWVFMMRDPGYGLDQDIKN
ncbi:GNAT family N-acetyltransferase [Aspergillus homomorphus CBS 101889]|uniref:Acyl-CoA N-acyltransferase n=1 Tax=Aspergillus homomorphus (strain CBS 101889) TaxID=1450537 RepID=A0A395HU94_ASPHC|nr:acyl-CoA N-acyltransferase [Aspergillus homomorphus CBS 101889]RAL09784.1 acyl-CoA N-acyltransferase [Aspergillus homomorphus CBS 101889]